MSDSPDFSSVVLTLWQATYRQGKEFDKLKMHNMEDSFIFQCFGEFDSMAVSPAGHSSIADSLIAMRNNKQKFMDIQITNEQDISIESIHSIFAIQRREDIYCDFFAEYSGECTKPLLFTYLINYSREENKGHIFDSQTPQDQFNSELYVSDGTVQKKINELKKHLKGPIKLLNGDVVQYDPMDFSFYLSLSSCDVVIFYKTFSYSKGHEFIDTLRSVTGAQYSYSICGIYEIQKTDDDDLYMARKKSIISSLSNKQIDRLTITHGIGDSDEYKKWVITLYGWINTLIKKDKEPSSGFGNDPNVTSIGMFSRLGTDDMVINIENISFTDLVEVLLGINDNGDISDLFSDKNDSFKRGLLRPRLYLDIITDGPYSENQISGRKNSSYYKRAYDKIFLNFVPQTEESIHLIRALRTALFSCDHLAETGFAPELLDYVEHTFDRFLDKFENALENNNGHYTENIISDINDYLSALLGIVNNSLQWERTLFQSPGFITNLYEIPSQILHFASAFTRLLTKTLTELDKRKYRDCDYTFILRPMLTEELSVHPLFTYESNDYGRFVVDKEYKENPLARVRIPMHKFFERSMLLEMTHEVAHIVGINIRQRKKRYQNELHMALTKCVEQLFYGKAEPSADAVYKAILPSDKLNELVECVASNFFCWKVEKEKVLYRTKIDDRLMHNPDNQYLFSNDDVRFASEYTLECQRKLLKDYFILLLPFTRRDAQPEDIKASVISFFAMEQRSKLITCKDSTDNKLVSFLKNKVYFDNWTAAEAFKLLADIDKIMEDVCLLTRESYADMVMLVALGLTAEDYIRYMYDKAKRLRLNEKLLYEGMQGERIISVLKTFKMGYEGVNGNYVIAKEADIKTGRKADKTLWESSVGKMYDDMINNPDHWDDRNSNGHPCDMVFLKHLKRFETYDQNISGDSNMAPSLPIECIRKNVEYLRDCRDSWELGVGVEVKEHFKELRTIYHNLNKKYDWAHRGDGSGGGGGGGVGGTCSGSSWNPLSFLALSDWFSNNLK